jgi:hypothetical protein
VPDWHECTLDEMSPWSVLQQPMTVVFEIICRRFFVIICRKHLILSALTHPEKLRRGAGGEDLQVMKGK